MQERLVSKEADLPNDLRSAIQTWQGISWDSGERIFLKGGAVRDLLTNYYRGVSSPIADLDLFVYHNLFKVIESCKKIGGQIVKMGKRKRLARYLVHVPGVSVPSDLSLLMTDASDYDRFSGSRENLDQFLLYDALYSDFDVNTISLNLAEFNFGFPLTEQVIDPLGGVDSIRKGEINLVSDRSLFLNPAVILRAIKLAHKTQSEIHRNTVRLFKENIGLLTRLESNFYRKELKEAFEVVGEKILVNYLKCFRVFSVRPETLDIILEVEKEIDED